MFKKKTLNFTYEKVSRDMRHAETLKIREVSRFKRLSMIRSINDSDLAEKSSVELKTIEKVERKVPISNSRMEMLFKWKQEKQLKKEMEKKKEVKPFYAGRNKNDNKNLKSSFIAQPNSSFNSSKFIKSKIFAPPSSVEKNKIQNAKQGSSSSTIPSSNVPKSKQGIPVTTFQSSRIPNSKQTGLSSSNNTAIASKKLPTPSSRKLTTPNTLPAPVFKKLPTSAPRIDNKTASLPKVASNTIRAPAIKNSNGLAKSGNVLKSNDLSKPVNKAGTGLLKLTVTPTVSKGISGQSKMPVSSMNKKFGSNLKLNQKEALQSKESVVSRKGYCFKTAIANSSRAQNQSSQKTPITPKKLPEKITKGVKEKPSEKKLSEQCIDDIPDVTFNSDISVIKPHRTSFAPSNFTFRPPNGLNNFIFDDDEDDCDIYKVLEEAKLKFMSRTSTPSKDTERKSSLKNSRESEERSKVTADAQKSPNLSNSNNLCISELMTQESFKVKIDSEDINEVINKQPCNNSCIITADKSVNKQATEELASIVSSIKTEVKDADVSVNQQAVEELISLSPIKIEDNDTDAAANQQLSEELASIVSSIKTEIKVADASGNQQELEELFSLSSIKIENNDTGVAANQQLSEELASISSIKIKDVDANQQLIEELLSQSSAKIEVEDTDVIANQQACEELASISSSKMKDIDVAESQQACEKLISSSKPMITKTDKTINQEVCEEIMCDVNKDAIKAKTTGEKDDLWPFDGFAKSENVERDTIDTSQKIISKESQCESPKNTVSEYEDLFLYDNEEVSFLDSVDLKVQLMKLDDDSDEDISPQHFKSPEIKPNGSVPKRVSMLKRVSVMNSIAENIETDECISENSAKSSKHNAFRNTPRRSKKISSQVSLDVLDSDIKNVDSPKSADTPRRSLRLKKLSATNDNFALSPLEERKPPNVNPRRSLRLIDLNTPEKVFFKKPAGESYENMDPNKCLMDLESPTTTSYTKSKKVSLLYSPEKRKSIRKSIRGDLMAFSPV